MNILSNSSESLAGILSSPVATGLPAQTEFRFADALQAVQPVVATEPSVPGERPQATDCVLETLRQQATEAPIFAASPMVIIKTPTMEAAPEVTPVAPPQISVGPLRGNRSKSVPEEEPKAEEQPAVREGKRKKATRAAVIEQAPVVAPEREQPPASFPVELPPQIAEPVADAPKLPSQEVTPVASRLPRQAAPVAAPAETASELPQPVAQVDAVEGKASELPTLIAAPAAGKVPERTRPVAEMPAPAGGAPELPHLSAEVPAPAGKAPKRPRPAAEMPAPAEKGPELSHLPAQPIAPSGKAPELPQPTAQTIAQAVSPTATPQATAQATAPVGDASERTHPPAQVSAPAGNAPRLPRPAAPVAAPASQAHELPQPSAQVAASVAEAPLLPRPAAPIAVPVADAPQSPPMTAPAASPEPTDEPVELPFTQIRMPGLASSLAPKPQEEAVAARPVPANPEPGAKAEAPVARPNTVEVKRPVSGPPEKKVVEAAFPLEQMLAPFAQPVTAVAFETGQPTMPVETKVGSRDYQPLLEGKLPGSIRDLVVRELSGETTRPAQVAPGQRPLLAELMQRIQATEQPVPTLKPSVESPVTKPGLEPLMALLSEKKATSGQGSEEDQQSEPESDQPTTSGALHLALKTETPVESPSEVKAPVKVLDQVEHGQHLARLQGKALIEKPRELEVQLHSEKLGAVAARVKVEAGGQWTAHVQLRDAEVERSVRQELVQIQETRGLEGFTTSLSQDQRDQRGSFQGFSFDQQQRGPLGYAQKKSVNPSTFEDPLPIERVSSANGNSNGLNVRA